MLIKIHFICNPYRPCMYCELVKKTLAQIKLTNKSSEIKETEDEKSE